MFVEQPPDWTLTPTYQKVIGSDSGQNNQYANGFRVSKDNSTIVVGAHRYAGQAGRAYVYHWDGSEYEQVQIFANPGNSATSWGHGVSVNEDGSRLFIGSVNGNYAQAWEWNGSAYTKTFDFTVEDGSRIGRAMVCDDSGDRVAIGTQYSETNIWNKTGPLPTDWTYDTTVDIFDFSTSSWNTNPMGYSMSGDGLTLIRGVTTVTSGIAEGVLYTWRDNLGTWTNDATLLPVVPNESETYAAVVDMSRDGGTIVSGGPRYLGTDVGRGQYAKGGAGAWDANTTIIPTNTPGYDYFGFSMAVSLNGDYLAIGQIATGSNGRVHIYEWTGSAYSFVATHLGTTFGAVTGFGSTCQFANDGHTLYVGADRDTTTVGQYRGALYVLKV